MAAPVSPALFDQFARGWRGYVLIGLIALTASLFGAAQAPVMDADEARFVLTTRQILETGITPPGTTAEPVHALQAGTVRSLTPRRYIEIWPYRLPSALGLALAAVACLWGGVPIVGARQAFQGAVLFAVGIYASFVGMLATPDALLLGFTTLAMAALAHLRAAPTDQNIRRALGTLFWFALVCAMSINGVVPALTAALTLGGLAFWERRALWMRPLIWWPGLLLALVMLTLFATLGSALSFGAIHLDAQHMALPGSYLLFLPLLIFPATYALPAAFRLSVDAMRAPRTEPAPFLFLLAWAAPIFLLFELWPTKAPHNVLPAYPAIALMCGAGLSAMRGRRWRSAHPTGVVLFGVVGALIIVLTAGIATFMPGDVDSDLRRAVSSALIGIVIIGGAIAGLIVWRRAAARCAVLAVCALALSYSLREHILPDARALNVSGEVVDALARARLTPNDRRILWVVGYNEDSIVFLTRRATHLADPEEVGVSAKLGDALVVETRALAQTQAALAARNLSFETNEPPVRGLALDNGRRVRLYVGEITAAPADGPQQSPSGR